MKIIIKKIIPCTVGYTFGFFLAGYIIHTSIDIMKFVLTVILMNIIFLITDYLINKVANKRNKDRTIKYI